MNEKDNLFGAVSELPEIRGYILLTIYGNTIQESKSGISEIEYLGILDATRRNFDVTKALYIARTLADK